MYFPRDSVHIGFPGIRWPSLYPDYKDCTVSIHCVYCKYTDLYKTIRKVAGIITVFARHKLLREIHSMNTRNKVSLATRDAVIVCWAAWPHDATSVLIALIYWNTRRKSILFLWS